MSSNNTNSKVGTLTTFYDTFTDRREGIEHVVIPKIQRDYAQGRKSNDDLRENFLNALYDAIDYPGALQIELDFIYGNRVVNAGERTFYPIDGQQRLTTLFLLHLYVSKRTGKSDEIDFGKFSYQTRDSSKEFCKKLIEIEESNFRGIADHIRDQWWFTSHEEADPTISAMLNTLSDIDIHYGACDKQQMADVWERLKTNIKFWRLYLDDLNTTDDLYIKMNSRGKPLTDFEHFKAQVESYANGHQQFSLKIDTDWTDLLWGYREKENDDKKDQYMNNGLDSRFINLFVKFMLLEGVKMGKDYKELKTMAPLQLAKEVIKPNPSLVNRFTVIMNFFHSLDNVAQWFDKWLTTKCYECNGHIEQVYLFKYDTTDILRIATEEKPTLNQMLFIEMFFEIAAQNPEVNIPSVTRIIRNLIFNSRDELREERVAELVSAVDSIVATGTITPAIAATTGDFRMRQKELEVQKLKWMASNPKDAQLLKDVENHSLILGNGEIFSDTAGNFDTSMMTLFLQRFLYNGWKSYEEFFDAMERALLLSGDYAPFRYSRYLYGGRNWINWRDEVFANTNYQTMLPVQLNDMLEAFASCKTKQDLIDKIQNDLEAMAKARNFTWPYYLAKHQGMRHTESARYDKLAKADPQNYNRQMMYKNQYNGRNWNPYLYCIWEKLGNKAKLGEYDSALVIPELDWTVTAAEHSFIVSLPDGSKRIYPVRKNPGSDVDAVDRIEWFTDIVNAALSNTVTEHR